MFNKIYYINRALEEESLGIKINETPINTIRYADDTVIIAESIEVLQALMDRIVECTEDYSLKKKDRARPEIYISQHYHNSKQ